MTPVFSTQKVLGVLQKIARLRLGVAQSGLPVAPVNEILGHNSSISYSSENNFIVVTQLSVKVRNL